MTPEHQTGTAEIAAPLARYHRCGLVLGGGGSRGLAGIGVMEVLEQVGFRPAAVTGTSMGALLGAFLAAGYGAADVHAIVEGVRWTDVLDISVAGGIIRGQRFGRWLEEYLPTSFAGLEIPLTVAATDIDTGELVLLREGDLIPALRATCAFPGAFAPVQHAGRNLVDGGLLVTVPVSGLKGCGVDPDFVVACDFGPPRDRRVVETGRETTRRAWNKFWDSLTFRRRNLAADILLKAVDIMQSDMCERHLAENVPDLLIRPNLPAINIEDFRRAEEIVQAGAVAARDSLAAWNDTERTGGR